MDVINYEALRPAVTCRGAGARCFLALALPLVVALGACSSDTPEPTRVTVQDTGEEEYPNLSTVPDQAPPVSSEEIRQRTAEGLAADRSNAKYSSLLTPEGTEQPAAQPPGPPPPEPAPVPEETVTVIEEETVVEEDLTVTHGEDTDLEDEATVEDAGDPVLEEEDRILENSETNVEEEGIVEDEVTIERETIPVPETGEPPAETESPTTTEPGTPGPSSGTPPTPSTTTTGGVTEVTPLSEVCAIAEEWEREVYNCDDPPEGPDEGPARQEEQGSREDPDEVLEDVEDAALAPSPAPAVEPILPAVSTAQSAPAPDPAPQVAEQSAPEPVPAAESLPEHAANPNTTQLASSNSVCDSASISERVAYGCDGIAPVVPTQVSYTPAPEQPSAPVMVPTPGMQAPLSINPPAVSMQTVPDPMSPPPGVAAPPPAPDPYSVASMTSAPAPQPANESPTPSTSPETQSTSEAAPAPAAEPGPSVATVTAAPSQEPAQGTVGSGRVELVGVIYFAHGSSALDGRDAQVLAQIAKLHQQYGGIVRVVGHASARTRNLDQVEHELVNFEVSLDRASAVARKLIAFGVPQMAIITEARSDMVPVYHEFMPTGEAGNRRAEIYLEY